MSDPMHPTDPDWEMLDPTLHPPPLGVDLLLINEGGVLIKGKWYEGALAWHKKPKIPQSVKERVWPTNGQAHTISEA